MFSSVSLVGVWEAFLGALAMVRSHLPHAQPVLLYSLFLGWLYVFYAPFLNVSRRERADNLYAQAVKLLHAWSSVHVIVLHVVPAYANYLHHRDAVQSIGIVFIGFVMSFATMFRWWHWAKRSLELRITYASSLLQQALNSMTIASILTVHHFACSMAAEDGEEMSIPLYLSCYHRAHGPRGGILFLAISGFGVVLADYAYKCWFNDADRGILSGAAVAEKLSAPDFNREAHKAMRFNVSGDCSRDPGETEPDGEGMVSWYSVLAATTGLKTVFNKSVSNGRFDYRSMEAEQGPKTFIITDANEPETSRATGKGMHRAHSAFNTSDDIRVEPRESSKDFWFDFVADVGDGFNSTYTVASALAKPRLFVGNVDLTAVERAKRLANYVRDQTKQFIRRRRPSADNDSGSDQVSPTATPAELDKSSINLFGRSASPVSGGDDSDYLPRGRFVLVGGDLCYPFPTMEGFYKRWYKVYNDALPAPRIDELPFKKPHSIVSHGDSTEVPLASTSRPLMFVIPGNHDWIDGLETYRSTVLTFDHLGGWKTPQTTSYFVLKLPHNWWIFCLDNGMGTDIDQLQLQYFLHYARDIPKDGSVVLLCHDPNWLNDNLNLRDDEPRTQVRVSTVADALGQRLRMRLCGDIHNYTRYEFAGEDTADASAHHRPMYVVSGGGGAFLHGTTQPGRFMQIYGERFERKACYPPPKKRLAFRWALRFRIVNWKFDIFGSLLYCAIILPLLPITKFGEVQTAFHADPTVALSWPGVVEFWHSVFALTSDLLTRYFTTGTTQLVVAVLLLVAHIQTDAVLPAGRRILYASVHGFVHLVVALFLLALMSTTFDRTVLLGMMDSNATSWKPATVKVLQQPFDAFVNTCGPPCQYPLQSLNGTLLQRHTHTALGALDIVEGLAYLHAQVTRDDAVATTRTWLLYYGHVLWFYWLLAAPAVSFVVGMYMFICVAFLGCSLEHAYAAFQVEDWKNFLRIRIDGDTKELDVHVVGFKNVATQWRRNERREAELDADPTLESHELEAPSLWAPVGSRSRAKVVDRFVVTPTPSTSSPNTAAAATARRPMSSRTASPAHLPATTKGKHRSKTPH